MEHRIVMSFFRNLTIRPKAKVYAHKYTHWQQIYESVKKLVIKSLMNPKFDPKKRARIHCSLLNKVFPQFLLLYSRNSNYFSFLAALECCPIYSTLYLHAL